MKKVIVISVVLVLIIGVFFLKNKKFISHQPDKNNAQLPVKLVDGRQCYTYDHEATVDAPYTVNEFIDITINGKDVTGTKHGTQSGPDMTNGYTGTIVGTLTNNMITGVYSYTIEGSQNKEKEIYRAGLVGIEKLRYPLKEEGTLLVPDTTKQFQVLSYARVPCEASN